MKKFWIPIGVFIALGLLLAYGLKLDPHRIPSPLVDKPLPAFSLPTLDAPQRNFSNKELQGQAVLINVWASWCVACREEHELLMSLAKQNVPLIGLNYKDTGEDARQVLRQMGNPYRTVLVDADGRTGIDWGVYGVPETFLVDKNGVIRYKYIGPITPEGWAKELAPRLRQYQ